MPGALARPMTFALCCVGRRASVLGTRCGWRILFRCLCRDAGAHEFPLVQLITVAPPVNFFDFTTIPAPQCPWLLAQGEADEIVPSEQVFAWAQCQDPPPDIIRMPDVGTSSWQSEPSA